MGQKRMSKINPLASSLTRFLSMFGPPFLYRNLKRKKEQLPACLLKTWLPTTPSTWHSVKYKTYNPKIDWRKCEMSDLSLMYTHTYTQTIIFFSSDDDKIFHTSSYDSLQKQRNQVSYLQGDVFDPATCKYNFTDCSSLSELFQWGALN